MTLETPPLGIAVPHAEVPAFLIEQRRPIDTYTAAAVLGVQPATIRDWKRRGLVRQRARGKWDLDELIRARRMPRPRRSRDGDTPSGSVPLDTVVDRDHTFCLEGSAQQQALDGTRALGKAAGSRHVQANDVEP